MIWSSTYPPYVCFWKESAPLPLIENIERKIFNARLMSAWPGSGQVLQNMIGPLLISGEIFIQIVCEEEKLQKRKDDEQLYGYELPE